MAPAPPIKSRLRPAPKNRFWDKKIEKFKFLIKKASTNLDFVPKTEKPKIDLHSIIFFSPADSYIGVLPIYKNIINMYSIQWKMNIFKSFRFSLSKKKEPELTLNIGSGSRSNIKSAPANKLRLRPAPQHCQHHCYIQLYSVVTVV